MLERGIAASEESAQVSVNAAVGLLPVLDKDGIIPNCDPLVQIIIFRHKSVVLTLRRQITQSRSTVALNFGALRVGEGNEDLADAHLQQLALEVVWIAISTSQNTSCL